MKQITVDFVTRVKLIGIVGSAPAQDGGLDKLHALLGVFDQVKFSEAEMEHITMKDLGSGMVQYEIHDQGGVGPEFGTVEISLEEAQGTWLARQLKAWSSNATIHDLGWLDPLMGSLRSIGNEPKKGKRK